ncbi:LysR family transcriptional regulator [Bacillus massiliigorillae]|uniref:LysR family transcriptional regulator n=1 Tax=Bacillus massiliigorillae TaxID=1243664 RepID=UPI00039F62BB|nr:LysR family transcriptional regulator [Bacillus massiliigorillae]
MDFSSLEVFRTVAKEGSISKAAKALQYVQSNVTTKIKALEEELETVLFHRHSRGVTLTSSGLTLLNYAEQIHFLMHEARKAVQNCDIPQGSVSIGSMETTAAVRLPSILASYSREYPNVEILLETGTTAQMIESVLSYELEGAFIGGNVQHPDLMAIPYVEEELVLVSAAHCEAIDYENTKLLVFRNGCTYRTKLEKWCLDHGLVSSRIMEFGSLDAIIGCVSAGMGISLVPYSVVSDKLATGELRGIHLPKEYACVTTNFIHRRDLFKTTAFLKLLEKCEIMK